MAVRDSSFPGANPREASRLYILVKERGFGFRFGVEFFGETLFEPNVLCDGRISLPGRGVKARESEARPFVVGSLLRRHFFESLDGRVELAPLLVDPGEFHEEGEV